MRTVQLTEAVNARGSNLHSPHSENRVSDNSMIPTEYIRLLQHRARHLKIAAKLTVKWKGRFNPISTA